MSDLSSWPSHYDGNHAVLLAAGEKTSVANGFGLEYSKDSPKVLGMEGDSLLNSLLVILQQSEPYSRLFSTQLWYSLSLVLVLYWDDFHTLFSILKAFLVLLTRFLMPLPAPLTCLTMLPR